MSGSARDVSGWVEIVGWAGAAAGCASGGILDDPAFLRPALVAASTTLLVWIHYDFLELCWDGILAWVDGVRGPDRPPRR